MDRPLTYEQNKDFAQASLKEHMGTLLEKVGWKPGEVILDYGCGAGTVTRDYFLPWAKRFDSCIICMDKTQAMVAASRETLRDEPGVLEVIRGDLSSRDEQEENELLGLKCDKILAIHVLHFVEGIQYFLSRVHGSLSPGGTFAALVPLGPHLSISERVKAHYGDGHVLAKGAPTFSSWCQEETGETLRGHLEASGFIIEEWECSLVSYEYRDFMGRAAFLLSTWSNESLQQLTDLELTKFKAFLGANVADIANAGTKNSQPFLYQCPVLRFVVRKIK